MNFLHLKRYFQLNFDGALQLYPNVYDILFLRAKWHVTLNQMGGSWCINMHNVYKVYYDGNASQTPKYTLWVQHILETNDISHYMLSCVMVRVCCRNIPGLLHWGDHTNLTNRHIAIINFITLPTKTKSCAYYREHSTFILSSRSRAVERQYSTQ